LLLPQLHYLRQLLQELHCLPQPIYTRNRRGDVHGLTSDVGL
jgi:hypothetical protein